MEINWKRLGLVSGLSLALFAAGCGAGDDDTDTDTDTGGDDATTGGEIELSYVEWDTEVASTHVIGKVFEDLGYDVTLTPLDNAVMWQAVATDEVDGMVAAWLPGTHGEQFDEFGDQM